ncbi:MAG: MATE family efflux transporter [Hungatella sp.]
MKNKRREINQEIYHLLIPMIVENILQISAGLISTAMIGRLLPLDISAQGICIRVTDTLWCLYKGIAIGATIMVAHSYGAGRKDRARRVVEQTFLTEIPLAVVFQILLFFFGIQVLGFFTADAVVLNQAQQYMRIIVVGFPFLVIMSVVSAAFQGFGDTKTPMYIALVMNVMNIICGYILIFGVANLPGLGVRGAAMALVIAQISGALLGLTLLYRRGKGLFADTKREARFFSLDRHCVFEVYTMGIPAALESMFWQFSAIILSKVILTYGQSSFAAYQLGIQAETITEMPAIGFGTAATTLTARAIGKRDEELGDAYFKQLLRIALRISVITSMMLIFLPKLFMNLMTNNHELQMIGIVYVFVMGFIQIPQNLSRIYNGTLRANGYKNLPMYVAGFGIWIIRIPLCILIAYILKWDLVFIWLVIAMDQISRFFLSVFLYKKLGKKTKYHPI